MKIELESIVGYLAGREGGAGSAIRRDLSDPSSEASLFLEAIRRRSRALVVDQADPGVRPAGVEPVATLPLAARAGVRRAAMAAGLAASLLLAAASALGLGEARLRRLEDALARREAESRAEARRIEAALARVAEAVPKGPAAPAVAGPAPARPGPIEVALARVESGLGKLEGRIDGLQRPDPAPMPPAPSPDPAPLGADPAIVEIRRDLSALRRELVASDQAGARQVMELRLSMLEVGNLLRMALNRPPVVGPVANPNQGFNGAPGEGLSPEVMALIGDLGNQHHQARLAAIEQLSRMGQSAQGALPLLQQMIHQDADPRVRSAAQSAISAIRPR